MTAVMTLALQRSAVPPHGAELRPSGRSSTEQIAHAGGRLWTPQGAATLPLKAFPHSAPERTTRNGYVIKYIVEATAASRQFHHSIVSVIISLYD